MADTWTDPRGTVHQYQTPGTGLKASTQRALERQQVWSSIDPSFDNSKVQVTADGRIVKNKQGFPWWESAAVLAAPFAPMILGAAGGGGGAVAPVVTGGTLPAATTTASTSALMEWLAPTISAGAGLGGALIQKSSADKATDAQSDAADQALALRKQMYEQDRADYAPYRNIGAFSLGELGHLTGMPPDFGTKAVEQVTTGQPEPRQAVARMPPSATPAMPTVPPAPASVDQFANLPQFQSLRDLGAARQSASSFVRMRAPDGEESDVDPSEAAMFERLGARRV